MEKTMERTKGEWVQNGNNGIHTKQGNCIAITDGDNHKANAAFIVKAVNNHEKLVEALEGILKEYKYALKLLSDVAGVEADVNNNNVITPIQQLLNSLKD